MAENITIPDQSFETQLKKDIYKRIRPKVEKNIENVKPLVSSRDFNLAVGKETKDRFKQDWEATIEKLTGLKKREVLLEYTQKRIDEAIRKGLTVDFIFIDLNGFKKVNDDWGHDQGDRVLTNIGFLIKNSIRTYDMAGRLGGDELGVLVNNGSEKDGLSVAERLRKTLIEYQTTHYDDKVINMIGISIGIAHFNPQADINIDSETLVKRADEAMYVAKKKSYEKRGTYIARWTRNGPELYEPEKDFAGLTSSS